MFVQRCQDFCLVVRDTVGCSSRLHRAIGPPLIVRPESQFPFPVATEIMGFISIFKRSPALSLFEALSSTCLSRCQRDVRPPLLMSQGLRAFSRDSTWDSDIPSSCKMKDQAISLHSNHCREIRPSFDSGHRSVHST